MKANYLGILSLATALLAISCSEKETPAGKLEISNINVETDKVSFDLSHENITACSYIVTVFSSENEVITPEQVFAEGIAIDAASLTAPVSSYIFNGLEFKTKYVLSVAATDSYGYIFKQEFFTSADDPNPSIYLDGPANCYIVPEAGTYSFPAKKKALSHHP